MQANSDAFQMSSTAAKGKMASSPAPNGRPDRPGRLQQPDNDDEDDDDAFSGSHSSSEDVSEDEEGDELTPALDAAILQTLRKIRSGKGVYEKEDVMAEALREAEDRAKGMRALQRTGKTAKIKVS